MTYKRHNWIKYGSKGNIIKVEINDETGRRLDFFICNNNKDFQPIAKIIKNKYGFSFQSVDNDIKEEMDFLNNHRNLGQV